MQKPPAKYALTIHEEAKGYAVQFNLTTPDGKEGEWEEENKFLESREAAVAWGVLRCVIDADEYRYRKITISGPELPDDMANEMSEDEEEYYEEAREITHKHHRTARLIKTQEPEKIHSEVVEKGAEIVEPGTPAAKPEPENSFRDFLSRTMAAIGKPFQRSQQPAPTANEQFEEEIAAEKAAFKAEMDRADIENRPVPEDLLDEEELIPEIPLDPAPLEPALKEKTTAEKLIDAANEPPLSSRWIREKRVMEPTYEISFQDSEISILRTTPDRKTLSWVVPFQGEENAAIAFGVSEALGDAKVQGYGNVAIFGDEVPVQWSETLKSSRQFAEQSNIAVTLGEGLHQDIWEAERKSSEVAREHALELEAELSQEGAYEAGIPQHVEEAAFELRHGADTGKKFTLENPVREIPQPRPVATRVSKAEEKEFEGLSM